MSDGAQRVSESSEAVFDGVCYQTSERALEAATAALALCHERLRPTVCREAAVGVPTTGDLPQAPAFLRQAAGRGDLTPGEAGRLAALVGEAGKALELHDIEMRLQRLEGQQATR